MARILNRHPDVYILKETHLMEEFAAIRQLTHFDRATLTQTVNRMLTIQKKGYYRKNRVETYPETVGIVDALLKNGDLSFNDIAQHLFAFEVQKRNKKIPGDQTPRHVFYISEIKRMFPDALFINMIRDPRGVLLSQKYKWKAGVRQRVPRFETIRTFFNYHPALISIMWRKGIKNALFVDEAIKRSSMLNVKFEELTEHPEATMSAVCNFLGISYSDKMLDVTVGMSSTGTDEGKAGISRNVSKAWMDKLSPTDTYIGEKINKDLMARLGYPLSRVKPDPLKITQFLIVLPFQVIIIYFLNLNRMGNAWAFIKKRLK